jgi:hypothetical protein
MKKLKIFSVLMLLAALFMPVSTIGSAITAFLIGPERIRELFNALKTIDKVSVEESYLRQEQTIKNTNSIYVFDYARAVNGSTTNVEPQLVLLDTNDVFIATHVGVYIYEADTTKKGYTRNGLQTCINPVYFTAGVGFTPDHLNQLYQGQMKYKVANSEKIEAIDMGQFEAKPLTQPLWDVTLSALEADIIGSKKPEDGLKDLASFFVFDGSQSNQIILNLPIFDGIAWEAKAANAQNRIVVKPQGILVKGGARYVDQIASKVMLVGG